MISGSTKFLGFHIAPWPELHPDLSQSKATRLIGRPIYLIHHTSEGRVLRRFDDMDVVLSRVCFNESYNVMHTDLINRGNRVVWSKRWALTYENKTHNLLDFALRHA